MIPIQSSELRTKSNAYPWLWMKIQIAVNQVEPQFKNMDNQRKSQLEFKIQTSACRMNVVPVEYRGCLSPKPFKSTYVENWWQWCWWHRYVGDLMMVTILRILKFMMLVTKKYIGDIFCMLVTFQSVANIIIFQNVMLVTDMLC